MIPVFGHRATFNRAQIRFYFCPAVRAFVCVSPAKKQIFPKSPGAFLIVGSISVNRMGRKPQAGGLKHQSLGVMEYWSDGSEAGSREDQDRAPLAERDDDDVEWVMRRDVCANDEKSNMRIFATEPFRRRRSLRGMRLHYLQLCVNV
ncbi:MAG TPA: hypothetical protein VEL06_03110 [Haliangiales bacterium]|nr:hypothetical protein [Haliangiales bacterium]